MAAAWLRGTEHEQILPLQLFEWEGGLLQLFIFVNILTRKRFKTKCFILSRLANL